MVTTKQYPRIAVVGAGLIGKTHVSLVSKSDSCSLAAIVDPTSAAKDLAEQHGVPWHPSLEDLTNSENVDGLILATPNHLHVDQAILCINAGIPTLIEKPVAHNVEAGKRLCGLANSSDVPLLVGHHRMHSSIISTAKQYIDSGSLGNIVTVSGNALFFKPDHYFEEGPWRTRLGGGPILINMIHEISNLRYLCGEMVAVQAISSNRQRNFEVEDTTGILFQFENGAVGTFLLSDTTAAAQSWEQTSQENPRYPTYEDEDCYHVSGTEGSLSIPTMRVKRHANKEERSWWKPYDEEVLTLERKDPLEAQLQHFCQVIIGNEKPKVSVEHGFKNLLITDAIVEAAKSGRTIYLDEFANR